MVFASARSVTRLAIAVVAVSVIVAAYAVPAFGHSGGGTSTITRSDCEQGRITVGGRTLSRQECLNRVGQRVRLASTGFDAWILALAGVGLVGAALVIRRRPSARPVS